MLTDEQINNIRAALTALVCVDEALKPVLVETIEISIATHLDTCNFTRVYLSSALDVITAAMDFARDRVDESQSQGGTH